MNNYLKAFLHRGLMFAGFGPIIMGIIYLCISLCTESFSAGGYEIFTAIISTYILAFVQAGASVFNQIEHWPQLKSTAVHFITLYIVYTLCYVINTWIAFDITVLVIYTLIFALVYAVTWVTVYICVRKTGKKLNRTLE